MDQGLKSPNPTREPSALRIFGFSFGAGMSLLTGLGIWHHWELLSLMVPGTLAVWHLFWALVRPKTLKPTYAVVHFIGTWVSNILTALVFTLFFYLIFSPVALLARLFKKDVIENLGKAQSWEDVSEGDNDPQRIEKLW